MRSSIKSTRRKFQTSYERLEKRCMLVGDIGVFLDGNTLVVEGDDLSNQIDVAQAANGDVVFTGRNSTTINGLDEFTFTQTFDRARFELNDGDDEVIFNGFDSGREFRFLGGSGNDLLVANSVNARRFSIRGSAGNDTVELAQSSSERSATIDLGDGDDVVAVASFDVGRNFKVYGDGGNDTFSSDALNVSRKFLLNLGSGDDQALFSGETNIGRSTRFRLGSGDDFLGVLPDLNNANAVFEEYTSVNAGSGDDTVVFGDSSRFERTAKFNGQSGFDSIDVAESEFERRSVERRFESESVDGLDELLDGVFATLDNAGFDSNQFGNNQVTETSIAIDVPGTDVNFTENDAPVAVFSDLGLDAAATENIVSATIELQGGDSNDLLSFADQNGIAGSFDALQNSLTLTGNASASQFETAIQAVLFESVGDDPTNGTRTATLSVQSEFPVAPVTAVRNIQVTSVDDSLDLVLPQSLTAETTVQGLNQTFEFVIEDADPDNPVTYQLDLEESGISADASQPTINLQTGEFSWTPSETGTFLLRVIATNDVGESDQSEFSVLVEDQVAEITEIENQTLGFNQSLEIPVQATGIDLSPTGAFQLEVVGDAVEGTSNLPVISDSGVITWTPDLLTSGSATFTVSATDATQNIFTETFEVTLPGFEPFQGNRQLASVTPSLRNEIYGDSFEGTGPPQTIDQSLEYTATISTEVGDIVVNLFDDLTPISVNSFVNLAEDGYYDGLSFHRVVESVSSDENGLPNLDANGDVLFERFVAQAGDPTNTSTGGPGFRINDEILPELTFDRPGILAYARTSAPNSNGSQFFITYDATSFQNDEDFTIFGEVIDFGQVIDGQNALDRLNLRDPGDLNPADPTIIESISITAT